jgi:hypothetical protein
MLVWLLALNLRQECPILRSERYIFLEPEMAREFLLECLPKKKKNKTFYVRVFVEKKKNKTLFPRSLLT